MADRTGDRARLRLAGPYGIWWEGHRWHVAYWTPWTWMPLSVRQKRRWWGALRIRRTDV